MVILFHSQKLHLKKKLKWIFRLWIRTNPSPSELTLKLSKS
jgi:hypothetical protein